jgi:hypothetical protein
VPDIEDFNIEQYFDNIEKAIKRFSKWHIERNTIELGFYSFGKFLIYVDLDNSKWPKDKKPVDHPLLQNLYNDGFKEGISRTINI